MRRSYVAIGLALAACSVGSKDSKPAEAKPPAEAAAEKKLQPPKLVRERRPPPPPAHAGPPTGDHAGKADIKWTDAVAWRTWEDGLAAAKREGKSICLVVYADWCPRCKELAPVFSQPDVLELTKPLVMVRQDGDARPEWLMERFGRFGSYVPRVFFLGPDGTLREDITSGNGRYPYFYTPAGVERLKASMRTAAEKG